MYLLCVLVNADRRYVHVMTPSSPPRPSSARLQPLPPARLGCLVRPPFPERGPARAVLGNAGRLWLSLHRRPEWLFPAEKMTFRVPFILSINRGSVDW